MYTDKQIKDAWNNYGKPIAIIWATAGAILIFCASVAHAGTSLQEISKTTIYIQLDKINVQISKAKEAAHNVLSREQLAAILERAKEVLRRTRQQIEAQSAAQLAQNKDDAGAMVYTGSQIVEVIDIEKLANAIYKAEGGPKTRHPYGILKKYKKTTPRQACINTIKSNLKRWDGEGDFIEFLAKTYAPIGADNDPNNLNVNWVKNVKHHYKKEG